MATAATVAELNRLVQKRRRIELNIARLKNRENKDRQADTRLKLRLGGLLYLIGWESESEQVLNFRLSEIVKWLASSGDEALKSYQIKGENILRATERQRKKNPPKTKMSADDRRLLNHQKITVGGLLVKHKLQEFPRGTLVGALIEFNEKQIVPSKKSS